jgi:hypothetical protein
LKAIYDKRRCRDVACNVSLAAIKASDVSTDLKSMCCPESAVFEFPFEASPGLR